MKDGMWLGRMIEENRFTSSGRLHMSVARRPMSCGYMMKSAGVLPGPGPPRAALKFDAVGPGWRLILEGGQADMLVLTPRQAELYALMPVKAAPDTSKFLLSPMPGLLASVAVSEGQEVKAGEALAVVEAMKMENVLRAERDGVVKAVNAKSGDNKPPDIEAQTRHWIISRAEIHGVAALGPHIAIEAPHHVDRRGYDDGIRDVLASPVKIATEVRRNLQTQIHNRDSKIIGRGNAIHLGDWRSPTA